MMARPSVRLLLGVAIVLLGAWLRLDQFMVQVVTDDEWHALTQLAAGRSPAQIALSFGLADYSIPLTLLYGWEAEVFGLSELGMRWPQMLAGLLLLPLFPLWAARRFGGRVALVFALLLAISPLLVNYSRIARPYGLTLLLGYLAHYAFWRYWEGGERRWRFAFAYAACASLSAWLHVLSLPFVLAPWLLAGVPAVLRRHQDGGADVARLGRLAVPIGVVMAALLLPPLLADPGALLNKSGADRPTLDTLVGVCYLWLGTPSGLAVLICLGLAALGLPRLWRGGPLLRGAMLGVGLTLGLLWLSGPAWVHVPLTFGRYLLPAMVLLLLAIAIGVAALGGALERRWRPGLAVPVLLLPVLLLVNTPLRENLRHPNGNTAHSAFQVDYRRDRPGVRENMVRWIPLSPWWETLHHLPRDSVLVAAAPYYNFSPRWDAPRWERLGRQRVIPGFLTGLCVQTRQGEVPAGPRFALRNAVHLGDAGALAARKVDWVVFQKPYLIVLGGRSLRQGQEMAHCLDVLRERLGEPIYEDAWIAVFPAGGRR